MRSSVIKYDVTLFVTATHEKFLTLKISRIMVAKQY